MKIFQSLLVVLLFVSCRANYTIGSIVEISRIADQAIAPDPGIEEIVKPYRSQMGATMNEVIGFLKVELVKELPESNIGNWLADMMREEASRIVDRDVDFAVQNYGGIRISTLTPGPITIGEIFEIMPFDNLLVIMEGNGEQIQVFLDHIAASGGWPTSSGLRFEIMERKAVEVRIQGKELHPDKMYSFALPDYIANGGSGSFFLKDYARTDTDALIRDTFIQNIKRDTENGYDQEAYLDGRIKIHANE